MKKIKAFFDNGRSKKEEEKEQLRTGADSDYAAAVSKLPKLETLAVNMNIMDSLPLPGSKVQYTTPPPFAEQIYCNAKTVSSTHWMICIVDNSKRSWPLFFKTENCHI